MGEFLYDAPEAHWTFNCILCPPITDKTRSKWHQIPIAVFLFKSLLNVGITHTLLKHRAAYMSECVCVYVRIDRPYRRHV